LANRPIGGGSAFGGSPSYSGGVTVGSGTKNDPYRAASREEQSRAVNTRSRAIVAAYEAERRGDPVPEGTEYVVRVGDQSIRGSPGFAARAQELFAQEAVKPRVVEAPKVDELARMRTFIAETGGSRTAARAVLSDPYFAERAGRAPVSVPAPFSPSAFGLTDTTKERQAAYDPWTPSAYVRPVREFAKVGRSATASRVVGYQDVRTGEPAVLRPSAAKGFGLGVSTRTRFYDPLAGERWGGAARDFTVTRLPAGQYYGDIVGGFVKEVRGDPLRTSVGVGAAYAVGGAVGLGYGRAALSPKSVAGVNFGTSTQAGLRGLAVTGAYTTSVAGFAATNQEAFGRGIPYAVGFGAGMSKGLKTVIPDERVGGVVRYGRADEMIVSGRRVTKSVFARDVDVGIVRDAGFRGRTVRVVPGEQVVKQMSVPFARPFGNRFAFAGVSSVRGQDPLLGGLSGRFVGIGGTGLSASGSKFSMGGLYVGRDATGFFRGVGGVDRVGSKGWVTSGASQSLGVSGGRLRTVSVADNIGVLRRVSSPNRRFQVFSGEFMSAEVGLRGGLKGVSARGLVPRQMMASRKASVQSVFKPVGVGRPASVFSYRNPVFGARVPVFAGGGVGLGGFAAGLGFSALGAVGSGLSSVPRSASRMAQVSGTQVRPVSTVGARGLGFSASPRSFLGVSQSPQQAVRLSPASVTSPITRQAPRMSFFTPPMAPLPRTPPPPPPPVVMPGFPPLFGMGGATTAKGGGKRGYRYASSLISVFQGLTTTKTPKGVLTGLEVRPVVRGGRLL
jgi:hypothetical protein